MTPKFLQNKETGVVFAATPDLLARGDLVPVANEKGDPLISESTARHLESEVAEARALSEMLQRDLDATRERSANLAEQVLQLQSDLDAEKARSAQLETDMKALRETLTAGQNAGTPPAVKKTAAKATGVVKSASPGGDNSGDIAGALSQAGL